MVHIKNCVHIHKVERFFVFTQCNGQYIFSFRELLKYGAFECLFNKKKNLSLITHLINKKKGKMR